MRFTGAGFVLLRYPHLIRMRRRATGSCTAVRVRIPLKSAPLPAAPSKPGHASMLLIIRRIPTLTTVAGPAEQGGRDVRNRWSAAPEYARWSDDTHALPHYHPPGTTMRLNFEFTHRHVCSHMLQQRAGCKNPVRFETPLDLGLRQFQRAASMPAASCRHTLPRVQGIRL